MRNERFGAALQNPFEKEPAWLRYVKRHKGALSAKVAWPATGLQEIFPVNMEGAATWSLSLREPNQKGNREMTVWLFDKNGNSIDAYAVSIVNHELPSFDKQTPYRKPEPKVVAEETGVKYDHVIKPEEEKWTEIQKELKKNAGKLMEKEDWDRLPFKEELIHQVHRYPEKGRWSLFLGDTKKPSDFMPWPHRTYGVVLYNKEQEVSQAIRRTVDDFPLQSFPPAEPAGKRARDQEKLESKIVPAGDFIAMAEYPVRKNRRNPEEGDTLVTNEVDRVYLHEPTSFSKVEMSIRGGISMFGLHNHGLAWKQEEDRVGTEVKYWLVQVGTNRVMLKGTCRVNSAGHIVHKET